MQQIQTQNGVLYQPFFYPSAGNVDLKGQQNSNQLATKSSEKTHQSQSINMNVDTHHNKQQITEVN